LQTTLNVTSLEIRSPDTFPKPNLLPIFFFFLALGFEFRASRLLDRHSYRLSHSHQSFFVRDFFEIGSCELFVHDPPDLCLLSSQDYRRESPVLGSHIFFSHYFSPAVPVILHWIQ
jgi:hypothetical protein